MVVLYLLSLPVADTFHAVEKHEPSVAVIVPSGVVVYVIQAILTTVYQSAYFETGFGGATVGAGSAVH
jgi:hypothetical protein